jgi:hypothetical protein
MRPARPINRRAGHEAEKRFIDQGGRLQQMTFAFIRQITPGQAMQLCVDDRRKLFKSRGVTLAPSPQHTSQLE